MGVRKRVTRQVVDGGIVVAIVCGLLIAQQRGCFESNPDAPTVEQKPPCSTSDPWQTACDRSR